MALTAGDFSGQRTFRPPTTRRTRDSTAARDQRLIRRKTPTTARNQSLANALATRYPGTAGRAAATRSVQRPSTGSSGGRDGDGGGGGFSFTSPGSTSGSGAEARVQEDSRLDELRAARLEAALAAITAQFNSDEGELVGQQRALEALFATSVRDNERTTERTTEAVGDNAADRGILRSGLFAQNTARALAPLAEQRADIVSRLNPEQGSEGTEIRAIMSALELLGQQEESAIASAKLESEQGELDVEQMIALIKAGLQ